jgi:hypothetical protein
VASSPSLACVAGEAQQADSAAESESSFAQALLAAIREVTGFGDLEFDSRRRYLPAFRGSQVVFVRRLGATPFVRIWSPLVRGVDETPICSCNSTR